MEKSGGFDVSKLSTASKHPHRGDPAPDRQFLEVAEDCFDFGGVAGLGETCPGVNAWSGSGSFFGLLMGPSTLALLIWEGIQLAGAGDNIKIPIPASKLSAYLGFAVAGFGC